MMKFLPHPRNVFVNLRLIALVCSLASLLFVAACSPTEPAYPSPPKSGSIELTNSSINNLSVFRIRQAGSDKWGTNYFGGSILAPGYYVKLFVPAGTLDIRIESPNGTATWTYQNYLIEENQQYSIEIMD